MEKKNTMLLTIIAVATLLVAVVGATFAYFTAQNGASGSTTVTVTTETIGAITVSNEDPALYLDLTAAQMQEGVTGSYWATKIKGAEPATNYASADKAVIAKLNVSGGGEETVYSCNFKITVDKTDVTLAYGDAAVVFALENNAEILGVTTGREIDYTTLLNEYTVNFTRVGDTEEDLPLVSVSMRVSNTEVEQGFAGETLTTTFTSSDLECEVVDESDVKTLSGTWRFNEELTAPSERLLNANYIFDFTIPYGLVLDETEGILISDKTPHEYGGINLTLDDEHGFIMQYGYSQTDDNGATFYLVHLWPFYCADLGNWSCTEAVYQEMGYAVADDSSDFGQTITITSDTEVSAEFYEWFKANAKPVIEVDELPTENIDTSAIYKTYEYTDVDSTDPTTMVAGTYRFNDVLNTNIPDNTMQDIEYTVTTYIEQFGMTVEFIGSRIEVDYVFNDPDGSESQRVAYYCTSSNPRLDDYGAVYPFLFILYDSVFGGWESSDYDGFQIITIAEDQEVSDEFGTWFAENAKLRGDAKYHQYIDGTWVEQ